MRCVSKAWAIVLDSFSWIPLNSSDFCLSIFRAFRTYVSNTHTTMPSMLAQNTVGKKTHILTPGGAVELKIWEIEYLQRMFE